MKKLLTKKFTLPGSFLLMLFSALLLSPSMAGATHCIDTLDFKFTIDNNSKTVKFISKVSSDALAVKWDFGDGDYSSDRNVKHTYDSAGYYKVCLTAYGYDSINKTRCSTTVCKRFKIIDCDQLKANFGFKTDDLSAKFEAKANSRTVVFGWTFGDGSAARGKEAKHTYKKEGKYKVCLVAKDTVTDCVTRVCKEVKVEDPCKRFEVDFEVRTDGLTIKAIGKSNSKNASIGFIFGDGNSARGDEVKHTYAKDGKYTICVVAKDTVTGCVARKCKDIKVSKCDLKVDFEYKTEGLSLKAAGKSNSRNAVLGWTFGDGNSDRGSQVKHEYKKEGKYTLCLIAKDTVTGCVARKCVDIKVEKKDSCNLKADFEFSVSGNEVKFRAKANQKARFIWDFGDGSDTTGETAYNKYKKPGTYTVCVTAVTANSNSTKACRTKVCKRIVIKDKGCDLKADFKFKVDGQKLVVKAEANQKGVLYYWSFGDGTSGHKQEAKHRYKKPGVYEVCLIVFNPKTKCKVCVCKRVKIEKPCNLKANFKITIYDSTARLKARSNSKNAVYGWSFGDGTSQRGNPVKHTYSKPGVYKVTLYVKDTVSGCTYSLSKRLIINPSARSMVFKNTQQNSTLTTEDAGISGISEVSSEKPDWNAGAYPVPAVESVDFKADKPLATVEVYNAGGTSVLSTDLDDNQNIDITALPTGYYYARLTADDGTVKIVKFVKSE